MIIVNLWSFYSNDQNNLITQNTKLVIYITNYRYFIDKKSVDVNNLLIYK